MKQQTMNRTFAGSAILLSMAMAMAGEPAWSAGDAAAGKDLARRWCMSCHVVDKTGGGSDVVAGFATIAATRTPDYMRTFLANPKHPMPNPQLSTYEIDDIVAYIESLKQQ